jgi:hypothetical protein
MGTIPLYGRSIIASVNHLLLDADSTLTQLSLQLLQLSTSVSISFRSSSIRESSRRQVLMNTLRRNCAAVRGHILCSQIYIVPWKLRLIFI